MPESPVERRCCLATANRGRRVLCIDCIGLLRAYAQAHGNAETARVYGVHETTIAKLRRMRE